jgi:hypothetical protein
MNKQPSFLLLLLGLALASVAWSPGAMALPRYCGRSNRCCRSLSRRYRNGPAVDETISALLITVRKSVRKTRGQTPGLRGSDPFFSERSKGNPSVAGSIPQQVDSRTSALAGPPSTGTSAGNTLLEWATNEGTVGFVGRCRYLLFCSLLL